MLGVRFFLNAQLCLGWARTKITATRGPLGSLLGYCFALPSEDMSHPACLDGLLDSLVACASEVCLASLRKPIWFSRSGKLLVLHASQPRQGEGKQPQR
jgi:hypothetical protein